MLQADLHTHSLFSPCGLHTVVEMLTRARELGVRALAVTDHGPRVGGRLPSTFFERLANPVPGIALLKGIECNLEGDDGRIDLPERLLPYCDVVLLGIHPNTAMGLGPETYTSMLLSALRRNPAVDIVSHPHSAEFPLDLPRLAAAAAELDVALELNNSKVALRRVGDDVTCALVRACTACRCRIAVCSDAHALNEIGDDRAVRPILADLAFPSELLVNDTLEAALAWVQQRRARRAAISSVN